MKLIALIHEDENGEYWAEVPALPGCISGGDTVPEASANIKEAAEGLLEIIREDIEAEGFSNDILSLGDLLAEADPECDTKLFFSVLAHNYFQLSSCDTEDRLKNSSSDTRLAELAI